MFFPYRSMTVLVLGVVSVALAACSTSGLRGNSLRGHTQSAALFDDRSAPSYSGRYLTPPRATPPRRVYPPASGSYQGSGGGFQNYDVARGPLPDAQPSEPSNSWYRQPITRAPVRSTEPATQPDKLADFQQSGWARWMGDSWRDHVTASGELFDPGRMTGAHASLPLPSFVYVTNRANGRTVLIRINDRVPASDDRIVIVSQLVADLLDFRREGRAKVDIQYAGPAADRPNMQHEEAFLKAQPWFHPSLLHGNQRTRTAGTSPSTTRSLPGQTYPRWDGTRR